MSAGAHRTTHSQAAEGRAQKGAGRAQPRSRDRRPARWRRLMALALGRRRLDGQRARRPARRRPVAHSAIAPLARRSPPASCTASSISDARLAGAARRPDRAGDGGRRRRRARLQGGWNVRAGARCSSNWSAAQPGERRQAPRCRRRPGSTRSRRSSPSAIALAWRGLASSQRCVDDAPRCRGCSPVGAARLDAGSTVLTLLWRVGLGAARRSPPPTTACSATG